MRAWIYDRAIKPLTVRWYRSVLERLEPGTLMLDIGIGTGSSLVANASLLRERNIRVVGVDIDPDYVKAARKLIQKHGIDDLVEVRLESVYDHRGGPYDAVYFAASFMLMPDPAGALRHVMRLLTPSGRVFFTQTFHEKRSPLLEKAKPLLVKVTTIDFGKVTYEEDFIRVVKAAGMEIIENEPMQKGRSQTFRRVVGRPASGVV